MSRAFAIRIVRLAQYLRDNYKEYALADQIIRSGTSICANVREAKEACSRPDFINKMNISLKEAGETLYWLDILHETDYLTDSQYQSLNDDCKDIYYMLTSICKTSRKQQR